MGLNIQIG